MIEVFLNIRQSSRFSCAMQKFSYWPLLHVLSTWCLVAQVLISILFCKHFQVVLVRNNFYRGAIFLGGNFPGGGLAGGRFSLGKIFLGAIIQGEIVRVATIRGTIFLGGQLSRYNFFRIKLFKVIHSNERKISWNFFWITLFNKEKIWWMLSPQNSPVLKNSWLRACLWFLPNMFKSLVISFVNQY